MGVCVCVCARAGIWRGWRVCVYDGYLRKILYVCAYIPKKDIPFNKQPHQHHHFNSPVANTNGGKSPACWGPSSKETAHIVGGVRPRTSNRRDSTRRQHHAASKDPQADMCRK